MIAPDKIYVHTGAHLGMLTLTTIPVDAPDEQEYIRKDALLELAKGEIMPGNSAEGKGWNWALQTLIEKIKSL